MVFQQVIVQPTISLNNDCRQTAMMTMLETSLPSLILIISALCLGTGALPQQRSQCSTGLITLTSFPNVLAAHQDLSLTDFKSKRRKLKKSQVYMLFRHKLPLTVGGSVLVKTFRYETLAFMFIGCNAIVFFTFDQVFYCVCIILYVGLSCQYLIWALVNRVDFNTVLYLQVLHRPLNYLPLAVEPSSYRRRDQECTAWQRRFSIIVFVDSLQRHLELPSFVLCQQYYGWYV